MTEYNNQQQHLQNDEYENGSGLTLHDLLQMVLANWYWFALSVLICLGVAYYYLASTPKIYSRTATILVKDSRKGGDMELGVFSDLVGFQNRRNVDNEVYILQSHRLMSEVVKRLHLTVNYSVRDGLRTLDLYGRSPIEVDFIDDDNQRLSNSRTAGSSWRTSTTSTSPSRRSAGSSAPSTATRSPPRWGRWSYTRRRSWTRPTWTGPSPSPRVRRWSRRTPTAPP